MKFSVLLSLYYKENPVYLSQSLDSIFHQTLRADEVILVEDGLLTQDLDEVVSRYKKEYPELKVIQLENNCGLGKALNEGLKHCSYDLVVRVDTDDICKNERFEKQVLFMIEHPDIDVCSAYIDEFDENTENVCSTRSLPENHAEIYKFGQRRNPINHPVSVFRKHVIEDAGSYQHFWLFEDYYLWARLMVKGAKFHNLPEPLLYFRRSAQMIKRRGGIKYAWTEIKFQFTLHKIGYISLATMIENILIRLGVRIAPNWLRGVIYSKLLRK